MNLILSVVCAAILLPKATAQSEMSANLVSGSDEVAISSASPVPTAFFRPFSRFAVSGAVSSLGIGAEVTTNLNPHLNLRATGSLFHYGTTFDTNGFAANGQLKLASARVSLDVYPFHSGFRISPGMMFYNQDRITAVDTLAPRRQLASRSLEADGAELHRMALSIF
ncbi:MAG TPA: hypothetical protein VGI45_16860 [Terracidiphilus sp.]|jgi:hypothetical protein